MTDERKKELYETYRNGLLNDTIPFWTTHGYDREYGGIMTGLDRRGRVIDTDKGVWQQGRFAWMLGWLYNNVEKRQEWLDMAKGTLDFDGVTFKNCKAPRGVVYGQSGSVFNIKNSRFESNSATASLSA